MSVSLRLALRRIRPLLPCLAIAAGAIGLAATTRDAFAQNPGQYNVWSGETDIPLTLQPTDEYYCYLSGFFDVGTAENGLSDTAYVDYVNGSWQLSGSSPFHSLSAAAYCYPYNSIVNGLGSSSYSAGPWESDAPNEPHTNPPVQWYSGEGEDIWDSQALCNIGGIRYDGNPFTDNGQPSVRIRYQVGSIISIPANPIITLAAALQFTSAQWEQVEAECLWFPGSTSRGFSVSGPYTSFSHTPASGEIVLYDGSTSEVDLGSASDQMCVLTGVNPSAAGPISVNLIQSNDEWYLQTKNALAYASCIRLNQEWPGH